MSDRFYLQDRLVAARVEELAPAIQPHPGGAEFHDLKLAIGAPLALEEVEELAEQIDEKLLPVRALGRDLLLQPGAHAREVDHPVEEGEGRVLEELALVGSENLQPQVGRMFELAISLAGHRHASGGILYSERGGVLKQ